MVDVKFTYSLEHLSLFSVLFSDCYVHVVLLDAPVATNRQDYQSLYSFEALFNLATSVPGDLLCLLHAERHFHQCQIRLAHLLA